ncbi:MAG: galactosamine-6-phosphate isomerase [Chloroflexota bacterium]
MKIIVTTNHEELSQRAADLVVDAVRAKPNLTLCLATGSTPTRTYELLAAPKNVKSDQFAQVSIIKLDEWGGLAMDDPATCEVYLQQHICQPLGINSERYLAFQSDSPTPEEECLRIQKALEKVDPIDLCILGLGANGHLGFNEPAEWLNPFPHVATLTQSTLQHPMTQQTDVAIPYGLTLGMANILQARQILLLVNGRHKRMLLEKLLASRITTGFPASFLWLHPNVTVICDQEANPGGHVR